MEVKIGMAKTSKYATEVCGDTCDIVERPHGGISALYAMKDKKVSCTLTVVSADLDTETAVISRNSNCPVIIKTPEYETVYDENVEPIGVNRHMKPLMYEVPLTAGMLIVSYTDGIAHAGKKRLGHPADFEKIMEIVRKNEAEDVAFIAKSIMDYALELGLCAGAGCGKGVG